MNRKLISNKRMEGESFKDYKERRKRLNQLNKIWLRGRLVWTPIEVLENERGKYLRGSYRNPLRQPICCLK